MARTRGTKAYDRGRVQLHTGPDFDDKQLQEMQRLGLFDEEIDELRKCLRGLQARLKPGPPVGPIRKNLQELQQASVTLVQVLERLEKPLLDRVIAGGVSKPQSANEQAATVARNLVQAESTDPDSLDHTYKLVEQLRQSVDSALDHLPDQSRQRVSISAISYIHSAWLRGYGAHVWDSDGHNRQDQKPQFLGIVTRADDEPFPQVAQFCFEAAGSDASVDTAIRAYRQAHKQRTRVGMQRVGFPEKDWEHIGKPGRPRGSGRSRK